MPIGYGAVSGEVGAADCPDVDLPPEPKHQPTTGAFVLGLPCVVDAGACGGGTDGLVEELGGCPGGRGTGGTGGSVEADDGVEVDLAALLVLGDLRARERGVVPQDPLCQPCRLRDLPPQVGGEACPQGRGVRVPQHRARVVVAVGIEWGAEERVVVGVGVAAVAAAGVGLVVDGAEAGRGEGGEDAGVCGDAGGDGLATAKSRGDELVGVVAVDGGTGGAAGGAAVAAADQQLARREPAGVEVVEDLAGRAVQTGAVPGQADRVRAAAESGYLPCEGCELAGGGELRQPAGQPGAALQRRPPGRRGGDLRRAARRGERLRRAQGGRNERGVRELEL